MGRLARMCAVVAGALSLPVVVSGESAAQPAAQPPRSLLAAVTGEDLGSLTSVTGVLCGPLLYGDNNRVQCVNGPIESGNSLNSGNFVNHGNPNNSGNLSSVNGSTNAANTAVGDSVGSGNTVQTVRGEGGGWRRSIRVKWPAAPLSPPVPR